MTRLIKKAIKNKDIFYQRFVKNKGFKNNLERFRSLQNNLKNTINAIKQQCFAKIFKKLSDPNINSKTYWYILNILTDKKVPLFLPISDKNRFITDLRE